MIHPVDRQVGINLRRLRKARGLSQADLGRALGVAFQQVQKYENGANRLSASALYDATRALDVPIGELYVGLPGVDPHAESTPVRDELQTIVAELAPRPRTLVLQLARALVGREDAWTSATDAVA